MALKVVHDTQDDIPEQFQELYSEQDGKFVLTGIAGVKTQDDIDKLNEALRKERNDHKDLRDKFKAWDGLDHEEVMQKLDRFDELEAAAEGKIDEDKINEMVEARIKTRLAPVERENKKLKQDLEEAQGTVENFETKDRKRTIRDSVQDALVKGKVLDTAREDALMLAESVFEITEDGKVLTKDNVGVTPGVEPEVWLTDIQEKRPHWWPASTGGGATGSGAGGGFSKNPFTAEHWNLTEQGAAVRENRDKAEQMAKAAGTTIGGPKPAEQKK